MKNIIVLCSALFMITAGFAQDLWKPTTNTGNKGQKLSITKQDIPITNLFTLDVAQLESRLSKAPARTNAALKSAVQLPFPNAKGELELFMIYEASVMHPDLAAKYPNIKSYVGQGITNPTATIRFSTSPNGLHGICRGAKSTFFINSVAPKSNIYSSYTSDELTKKTSEFVCAYKEQTTTYAKKSQAASKTSSDGLLRTYRLAVSTTAEYTAYFGSKANALVGIVDTMTYVNAIFETDFGITMELIPNTDLVIFEDADTDPYTPGTYEENTYGEDLERTLTHVIGSDNYDIGHLLEHASGNGGFGESASIGGVCQESKGNAYTAYSSLDSTRAHLLVAHEMGHQFGATHTFGHNDGSHNTNFEPGTGSTIMAYPGNNSDEGWDVVSGRDPYFHGNSIEMVLDYIYSLGSMDCATKTDLNNSAPYIAPQTQVYYIPIGTPFVLDLPVTDSNNGTLLTYCWEQMDDDNANTIIPDSYSPTGPAFRSYPPTTNSARYFPRLETILAGETEWKWEALPAVPRDLNFRLTVRDNHVGGGATSSEDVKIIVMPSIGKFEVTEPIASTWTTNTEQNVTWNVAGTSLLSINELFVDIFLSTDGGNTFPILLAENTPNDGEEPIIVPDTPGISNRIMVKAANSIFFDISDHDFVISESGTTETCILLESAVYSPDISDLISLVNSTISSTGDNSAAEVAFAYQEEKLVIAGNPTYLEGVFTEYDIDTAYTIIRNADDSLALVSEHDMGDIDCDAMFTITFICTTKDQYSYATNLPEVNAALHLHPEMALLSYFSLIASEKPPLVIRSAGPTGKMSPRSYKYLSDNDFWTLDEPATAQNDYLDIKKHLGWSLPTYWLPQEEYEENGGWKNWLKECSANYYQNQYTFWGVNENGEKVDLHELGYFALPRLPGDSY